MNFDPKVFGEGFHNFVQLENKLFGTSLGVVFHIATLIILFLVFRYGNKYRRLFTAYFTVNWLFLFSYWGAFGIIYWSGIGISYLAAYIFSPILLCMIVINWIRELLNPRISLDFSNIPKPRFLILIIFVWGFWYPTYIYSQGFLFNLRDLLYSNYGLMPCPTTMLVLSLLTLTYPQVNKTLYNLMAVYAFFIGTATVLTGWLPDIPFIFLGIYSLILAKFSPQKLSYDI